MRSEGQSLYGMTIRRRALLALGGQAALGLSALALIGCDDDDDDDDATATATATAMATEAPSGDDDDDDDATATATATAMATEAPSGDDDDDDGGDGGGAVLLSPTGTDPSTATPGGTIQLPSLVVPELLDPHLAQTGTVVWNRRAGDPLIEQIDGMGNTRPYLIESWEVPDPLTTVLHVRQGVPFHDREPANGRDMEARDVVYSLNSLRGTLYPEELAPRAGAFFRVSDIETMDAQTARVSFEGPSSVFVPGVMGDPRNTVIPEGIREHFGENLNPALPERHVGTGPFIPQSYQPSFEFERNPNYWNAPYPFFDRIEQPILPDRTTAVTGILSGQFHWLDDVTQQEQDLIKSGSNDVLIVPTPPRGFFYHMGLNTRRPGLDDPRLRQAFSLVTDRPALGQVILGNEEAWRIPGTVPWTYPEAIPQDELRDRPHFRSPTDEDLAEARKLLEATGFHESGLTLKFRAADVRSVHAYPTIAEYFADRVDRFLEGIEIQIEPQTYQEMLAGIQAFDFDIYAGGWTHEADATLMMSLVYSSTGGRAFTGYESAEMDGLLEAALAAVDDPEERVAKLREAQELAIKDMPVIPTHHLTSFAAVRPEVKDLIWTGAGGALTTYGWLES